MGPKDELGGEVYMPFWTKEREAESWDFKGKVENSQVDD